MKLPLYQIDAFASQPFKGNPAAVCPLEQWLPDETMQAIAEENNLAETAFFVATETGFYIRWFTPVAEVDLCGHATLASAYVLFHCLGYEEESIAFDSKSGVLNVSKYGELLVMDFPAQPPSMCNTPEVLTKALGVPITQCLQAEDYIAVIENESDLKEISPDYELLKQLDLRGVVVTAESSSYDFVVRFFAPKYGINEDPVTGSAYTQLMPYWVKHLGKTQMKAKQISRRGGEVFCELLEKRVNIAGKAVKYLQGEIEIQD